MVAIERSISECSFNSDDFEIRPLELSDLNPGIVEEEEGASGASKRRSDEEERRNSLSGFGGSDKFFSIVYGLKKKESTESLQKKMRAKMAWRNAVNKAKKMDDPWKVFDIGQFKTEKARRYRYKALQKKWVEDEVTVKMETDSFNHGAMRECFRMKKLSNFASDDWSKAMNYVAKRYMDTSTTNKTYFDDVKLQMDAKLWGEEFNRHNPPKKVDIFQMAVIEFVEREGSPLFHVEHFIEGSYIKYNSNSGYVSSKMRMTPHAFSHFSFEKSGHELIVVDVQGVGDLYTDPQIHTANGDDYGDGNLGTRGMALFFHSHVCNSICKSLSLSEFDMATSETNALKQETKKHTCPKTRVRGKEEVVIPVNDNQKQDFHEYFRQRSLSSGCSTQDDENIIASIDMGSFDSLEDIDDVIEEKDEVSDDSAIGTAKMSPENVKRERKAGSQCLDFKVDVSNLDLVKRHQRHSTSDCAPGGVDRLSPMCLFGAVPRRQRFDSESSDGDTVSRREHENEKQEAENYFSKMALRRSRPSNITTPDQHAEILQSLDIPRPVCNNLILGQVHLDVAKYHELNRFTVEGAGSYDHQAAVFHVQQAAYCGVVEGLIASAQLNLGLPHIILPDVELPEEDRNEKLGFHFMEEACRAGDRWSMVYLATALDTGVGLPPGKDKDWSLAMTLYDKAITSGMDDEGCYDAVMDTPPHIMRARQAAMILEGGHGLEKDPNRAGELYSEAAEFATVAMKGKLASKYYMDAENAWMQCEEEGEEE